MGFAYRFCNYGRHPLSGQKITASVFASKPFMVVENEILKGGIIIDMYNILSEYLQLQTEVIVRKSWIQCIQDVSVKNPDFFSTFYFLCFGLQVLRGEAQVSLSQIQFVYHLGDVSSFNFVIDIYPFERVPQQVPKYANIVLTLDSWTWLWFGISFMLVVLTMYATGFKFMVTYYQKKP